MDINLQLKITQKLITQHRVVIVIPLNRKWEQKGTEGYSRGKRNVWNILTFVRLYNINFVLQYSEKNIRLVKRAGFT